LSDDSHALIAARTANATSVMNALDYELSRWRFERCDQLCPGPGSLELRQLFWCESDEICPWTTLLISDIQNVFETAYCLSKALQNTAVVASRSYSYELWQFKAYLGQDCVLCVGDDADHELKWLPPALKAEKIPEITSWLHGNAQFEGFLQSVIEGTPQRVSCEQGLSLRSLDQGFPQLASMPATDWRFASWQR
jgi:hypothetical protein